MRIDRAARARARSSARPAILPDFNLGATAVAHLDIVGFNAKLGHGRSLVNLDDGGRRAKTLQRMLDDFHLFADGDIVQIEVGAGFQNVADHRQRPGVTCLRRCCSRASRSGGA